jgi:hypothetical protein
VYAGIDAPLDFPALVEYPFPVLTGSWIFVFRNPALAGFEDELWGTSSIALRIFEKALLFGSDDEPSQLRYSIFLYSGTSDVQGVGNIECSSGVDADLNRLPPICALDLFSSYPGMEQTRIVFPLAYADIGDNRLEALDPETGIRLTAYRLGYD